MPCAIGSSALVYTLHAHFHLWIHENHRLLWINVAENRHFLDNFIRSPISNFNKLCKVDTLYIWKIILVLLNQNLLLINKCPHIGTACPHPVEASKIETANKLCIGLMETPKTPIPNMLTRRHDTAKNQNFPITSWAGMSIQKKKSIHRFTHWYQAGTDEREIHRRR
jgi:hypothetical protein